MLDLLNLSFMLSPTVHGTPCEHSCLVMWSHLLCWGLPPQGSKVEAGFPHTVGCRMEPWDNLPLTAPKEISAHLQNQQNLFVSAVQVFHGLAIRRCKFSGQEYNFSLYFEYQYTQIFFESTKKTPKLDVEVRISLSERPTLMVKF